MKGRDLQPDAREGQAGPSGEADRLIVPQARGDRPCGRKPGNAGGGKGPWFKGNVGSSESREIGDEPNPPTKGSEVTDGVTRQSEGAVAVLRIQAIGPGLHAAPRQVFGRDHWVWFGCRSSDGMFRGR